MAGPPVGRPDLRSFAASMTPCTGRRFTVLPPLLTATGPAWAGAARAIPRCQRVCPSGRRRRSPRRTVMSVTAMSCHEMNRRRTASSRPWH